LSVEHLIAASTLVPRDFAIRVVTFAGLLAPWIWLVAIDRRLNRQR
jgi:hypothetical protein